VDADRGRDGAFRVPTVRNAGRTAPYFHHGAYATLEEVVDFYDRGGGRGLGLDVPNQDPEVRPLHLTAEERRALVAFMRDALDDTR
jgi:cytochrome c peroxidase